VRSAIDTTSAQSLRTQRTIDAAKERRHFWFIVGLCLLGIVSCIGAFYGAKKLVVVSGVAFTGAQHLKSNDLQRLVRIKAGDELFGVSSAEIRQRLLKSPWVKDAVIRKELTGRVLISIVEAVPMAILQINGRSMLVDREGVLLEEIPETQEKLLPVIHGIDPSRMRDAYLEALAFINIIHAKHAKMPAEGIVISGNRPEELSVAIDQISVRIGSGDFERKLADLQFVREEIAKRNLKVEYIDLRFANRIVVKPVAHDQ
jgi:cell division protein FtsQ